MDAVSAVKQVAPRARAEYLAALSQGEAELASHGLATPLRLAHFLAQVLHECGGFTVLRESLKYSAPRMLEIFGVNRHTAAITPAEAQQLAGREQALAERVYGLGNPRKARELGNTEPGDGFRYRGNGMLQTTGRGNHQRMGALCGLDLVRQPELATDPAHALAPALHEWSEGRLNRLADLNDIRGITFKVNGGFNGLADRQAWFERLWPLLRGPAQPAEAWAAGRRNPDVLWLQQALNDLGAEPPLEPDGRYGPATTRAVQAFQASVGARVDGVAGPVTRVLIQMALDKLR